MMTNDRDAAAARIDAYLTEMGGDPTEAADRKWAADQLGITVDAETTRKADDWRRAYRGPSDRQMSRGVRRIDREHHGRNHWAN